MITVDCNPLAFRSAGITTLLEACCLTLAGRAGLSGIRNAEVLAGLRGSYRPSASSIHQIFRRLTALGLVTAPQRGNQKGRPNLHQVTPLGLAVLASTIQAGPYPTTGSQTPLPL